MQSSTLLKGHKYVVFRLDENNHEIYWTGKFSKKWPMRSLNPSLARTFDSARGAYDRAEIETRKLPKGVKGLDWWRVGQRRVDVLH